MTKVTLNEIRVGGLDKLSSVPLKDYAWNVFSLYVRNRDMRFYEGECISCNAKIKDVRDGHAGHLLPKSR